MSSAGQIAGTGRHTARRRRAATAARWGTFCKTQVGGLALVVSSLVLAAPAHGLSGEAGQVPAAQASALIGLGQHSALLPETAPASRLPFERRDLAILAFGAAIVVLAGAGAPFLLRPLRDLPPALVTAPTASEPMLPGATVGRVAHASA